MSTYSVYNIKVDNGVYFTPGPTAGYVLTIGSDGSTYWSQGGAGAQGPTGVTGSQGPTGSAGTNGTNGVTGPTGPASSQSLSQTLAVGNTSGTYSAGFSYYIQTNPVINSGVTGTLTQSLTSNTYIYTLTGNTTFNYTNPTYSTYNFLVKAGTFSFTLASAGAWQTVGATALGFTGSFIMSCIYDGTDMWVSTVKNYSGY